MSEEKSMGGFNNERSAHFGAGNPAHKQSEFIDIQKELEELKNFDDLFVDS